MSQKFTIISIKPNKFEDFENTLWIDYDKVRSLIDFIETDDLQTELNNFYNRDSSKTEIDLDTIDVLYTRTHTYQLINSFGNDEPNYLGSILNYKRKTVKGHVILIKIKINDVNNNITYENDSILESDIKLIIKDMFFHNGFKIKEKVEPILYDNKYNVLDNFINLEIKEAEEITEDKIKLIESIKDLPNLEVNIFGIPFFICYKEGKSNQLDSTYLKNVGLFLNKKISEAYIICKIYPQCKVLSLDEKFVKTFIDLISSVPDEGELKDICAAYCIANKNFRTENVYVTFDDFYWSVKKHL